MSTLHDLSRRLMKLDDAVNECMKCGLCQAVCPTYGASGKEADVARGKLVLIENLAHEMIQDPEAVLEKLGRCLLCGSCAAACPPGVKTTDIFFEAKEIVTDYLGLHPAKKLVFQFVLAKPKVFNFAMRVGAPMQSLMFRKTGQPQATVCAPLLNFMIGARHIHPLAQKPLHARYGAIDEPRRAGGIKVAFFPGCLGDKMYTDMSEACLKALRHHNVAVFMPSNLACCGIPALSSGDAKGMVSEMQANLKALANGDFDYIVTPCASCTATIKEFWPRYANRVSSSEKSLIDALSAKAMDINEFLVKKLNVTAVETDANPVTVTYHDSCHLKKSLGVAAEARAVVAANPHYKLKEMAEADRCCGCGGSFNLFHYDFSRKIGQRKRNNVVDSGAQIVAAGCPACMMQLEDVLSNNNDPVQVKHTMELYAESLR